VIWKCELIKYSIFHLFFLPFNSYSGAGAHGVVIGEYLMGVDSIPRAVGSLLGFPPLPLVKICGTCSVSDAIMACDAGADIIGIIFAPLSKRCMNEETARPIVEAIRLRKRPTLICGVFANQSRAEVSQIVHALALDIVQFSGADDEVFVCEGSTATWAATHVRPDCDLVTLIATRNKASIVPLLDTFDPNGAAGGTGKTFDWSSLRAIRGTKFVVAGGLKASNVDTAIKLARPFAVDVCSGVESSPRVKDASAVREFVRASMRASLMVPTIARVIRMLVQGENPTAHG
jgi:phosphoribosylanthranilate isomerase